LLPGTRLAAERDRWGLVASPEPPYEILQTGAQTFEELETASRLSRAVDRFYNPPELHPVAAEAARRLPRFWEDLVAFAGDALAEPSAPSLENRFRTLDNFLAGRLDGLRHALHYAWLKHGFSAQHGLSAARPWKGPLPGNAVLVEGRPAAGGVRIFAADLDQRYAFVYARQRPAAAIYRLPPSEGSNLHRLLPKSLDGQA